MKLEAKVKVVELQQLYASPKELAKAYSLGHTHVYGLLQTMRESKRYRDGIVAYGKVLRVRLSTFEAFWRDYANKH